MYIIPYCLLGRLHSACMSAVSDMVRICTCVNKVKYKTNYIYLAMPFCRNIAALTNCTVIRRQSYCDVFYDQAAQTCFQTCPCIKRFGVLTPHVLKSSPIAYASIIKNEINKKCSCRPANLIRLRRRFPVTRCTMF